MLKINKINQKKGLIKNKELLNFWNAKEDKNKEQEIIEMKNIKE